MAAAALRIYKYNRFGKPAYLFLGPGARKSRKLINGVA